MILQLNSINRRIQMKNNRVANDGYTRFNEGYEKKGGVNKSIKTPRPAAPKPQSSGKNPKK